MLGLQGSSTSPKVYRCVACSATFSGLASLLVHQATHANTLHKVSAPPGGQNEPPFQSTDSASEHPAPPAVLPESPSSSFYICDCGEEFLDFDLMLEHKRSHASQMQPSEDPHVHPSEAGGDEVVPTPDESFAPVSQAGLVLSCPFTSKSPDAEGLALNAHKGDVALEDGVAMETPPQGQCLTPEDVKEERLEDVSISLEQTPEAAEERFQETEDHVDLNEKGEHLPKTDVLMKLLASAYTNRFPPPPSPTDDQNDTDVTLKEEDVPIDIMPHKKADVSQVNDLSIAQLKRLLTKPGVRTKSPSISTVLGMSRKKIVSLTKTFSPVVILETRQKLMDSFNKGTYGRYQCGRCRRVFSNIDRLTEHHFLHKKERIKCCRRCKQLIIGRLPLPKNHVCPQMANRTNQGSNSLKNKFFSAPRKVPLHSLNNAKKVFYCPQCKHSYARRWNLKTHRCHADASALSRQGNPFRGMLPLRPNGNGKTFMHENGCQDFKSVGIGTELTSCIKVEVTSPTIQQSDLSQVPWAPPAKGFSPFLTKSSLMEQNDNLSLSLLQDGAESSWGKDSSGDEGRWTLPGDEGMRSSHEEEAKASGSAEHTDVVSQGLHYFISDGVRRYPCNRCHKTYSRATTLKRHLRLCGFRPGAFGVVPQVGGQSSGLPNASTVKLFPCFVCGKTFNRKDNMMVHRKRCQLQRTLQDVDRGSVPPSLPGGAGTDRLPQQDEGGNWGIVGLPSVLPRRVTCECGASFTSPKLLVEHLQKHAQETYTCPTCGETVKSWADYEVHLQIHMRSRHQLLKGIQPPRTHPLLLRFQPQPAERNPQKHPQQLLHPGKKQRIVCTRCGNSFATRCSLRRHLSWNRCKGVRATNPPTPKTFKCSHCNTDFPNTISLLFHQRSGACKPVIKPVRCPVCLRWFGTMESLEKHLLTHKQTESYRCDVCQGTYPNLKSLKNHRRRIHRIMAGDTRPKTPELLPS
ncbi:zinc finger protein 616 [Oryzias melastigma]|uniref:Zinc finger protein 616-like n=1 Tax=Oryzias melastigma TaxID=30732 RepID=A0A3B3BVW0_ORYME|nr:zinc finger protein 616 [Oryzias melastigma]